jgi:hypothetical protein
MTSEFLPVYRDNLREMIEEFVPFVRRGKATFAQLRAHCDYYRALGIAEVLLDGDDDAFRTALAKSGQMAAAGLPHVPPATIVASQATAVFDALVVGDTAAAAAIAALLPSTPDLDLEYPEDFYFLKFILGHFLHAADHQAQLTAMQAALAGAEDAKYAACAALVARDHQAFAESLNKVLADHARRYQLLVSSGSIADELAATLPYISIDGIVLLRYADSLGLPTLSEYPLVPSSVRSTAAVTLPPDSWTTP